MNIDFKTLRDAIDTNGTLPKCTKELFKSMVLKHQVTDSCLVCKREYIGAIYPCNNCNLDPRLENLFNYDKDRF